MISMLSLFECITCSSVLCLEELKLIATVNRIFYGLGFLRLSFMYFKYDLILLRYSSTVVVFSITVTFIFYIIITSKITYLYWFIITFYFMLKIGNNISSYSLLNCFILFFQSYIFNYSVIYFFFHSFFFLFQVSLFFFIIFFHIYKNV